jgi:hypothetical protein
MKILILIRLFRPPHPIHVYLDIKMRICKKIMIIISDNIYLKWKLKCVRQGMILLMETFQAVNMEMQRKSLIDM